MVNANGNATGICRIDGLKPRLGHRGRDAAIVADDKAVHACCNRPRHNLLGLVVLLIRTVCTDVPVRQLVKAVGGRGKC